MGQSDNEEIFGLEALIAEHKKEFGIEPRIIGINWREPEKVLDGIYDAIEEGTPYDEYKELTKEEIEAYENGDLVF